MTTRSHTSGDSPGAGRRFPGCYTAIVTRNNDPKKLCRVRVRCPEVAGQLELSWARITAPMSGENLGAPWVPPVNARVQIIFEAEDQNRPVVIGGIWFSEGEKSDLPKASLGDADPVRAGRGSDTATGAEGASISEPSDPFEPEYPNNRVIKTPSGHLIEYDDTPGKERISFTHGKKKTWLEMHPNGAMVMGIEGKRYVVVGADDAEHVKGRSDVVVDGAGSRSYGGKLAEECDGYALFSSKKWEIQAIGDLVLKGNRLLAQAAAGMTLKSPLLIQIGAGVAPGPVVTTITHPVDYITGIPIQGVPLVQIG